MKVLDVGHSGCWILDTGCGILSSYLREERSDTSIRYPVSDIQYLIYYIQNLQ